MAHVNKFHDRLVPAKEAAGRIGTSRRGLDKELADGRIKGKRRPPGKAGGRSRVFVLESEIQRYIAAMPDATGTPAPAKAAEVVEPVKPQRAPRTSRTFRGADVSSGSETEFV